MKVTLANGLTVEGTESQVVAAAKALGYSIGNDGVYYNSTSRGLVRITAMDNQHLTNAVRKMYRTWANALSTVSSTRTLHTMLVNGPQDVTFKALVAEISRRLRTGEM